MPYFSQYAIEELPKIINDPEALQHLRVYTTIDPDLQRIAYEVVNKRLEKLDKHFPKTAERKFERRARRHPSENRRDRRDGRRARLSRQSI